MISCNKNYFTIQGKLKHGNAISILLPKLGRKTHDNAKCFGYKNISSLKLKVLDRLIDEQGR